MDKLPARAPGVDKLFETSWEVGNKVGGIYTVLSSKAQTLQELYPDRCIFLGPDLGRRTDDFTPDDCPPEDVGAGVSLRWGRWEVPGRPRAALVGFEAVKPLLNDIYGEMWRLYGVDSLRAYGDYADSCAFAVAAAMAIKWRVESGEWRGPDGSHGSDASVSSDLSEGVSLLSTLRSPLSTIIAHWDEWQTGMGLLWLKAHCPGVANVFTTHATSIGRSICSNGKCLYDYLPGYHGTQMAAELNMEAKHSVEQAAAREADAFTTVSEVTAREAEQLLGRRPLVTPNGFDVPALPTPSERRATRRRILEVAAALTGRRLPPDTCIVATSGRHEYRNKGLDLFLDALHVVESGEGKAEGASRPILALILVPAWCQGPRIDLQQRLDGSTLSTLHSPLSTLPQPYITHYIGNPEHDEVPAAMRRLGLDNNNPASGVVTIYVPCYLDGGDGIFDMTYYQMLPALDLTVFASYYEPWGYTPHESVAMGVPTVTTSLAGFGQWARESLKWKVESLKYPTDSEGGSTLSTLHSPLSTKATLHSPLSTENSPVTVVERTDGNYEECVQAVAEAIASRRDHPSSMSAPCRRLARRATWKAFMPHYLDAYRHALDSLKHRTKQPANH